MEHPFGRFEEMSLEIGRNERLKASLKGEKIKNSRANAPTTKA